jgi:hypothetical protein
MSAGAQHVPGSLLACIRATLAVYTLYCDVVRVQETEPISPSLSMRQRKQLRVGLVPKHVGWHAVIPWAECIVKL